MSRDCSTRLPCSLAADPGDERRTIHIGLDVFAPAGTAVRAPLAGSVHACADNDAPLDYGPVIILEHEPDGVRAVLHALRTSEPRIAVACCGPASGSRPARRFAAIGSAAVNGGWTPHLHLQVDHGPSRAGARIFQASAALSERAAWTGAFTGPESVRAASQARRFLRRARYEPRRSPRRRRSASAAI